MKRPLWEKKDPVLVENNSLGISISLNKVKESLFLDLQSLDALERSINSFHSKRVVRVPSGCSKELFESFVHERSLAFVRKRSDSLRILEKELLKTPSREESQRKRLFSPFGRKPLFTIPDSVRFWYVPFGSYRCAVLGSYLHPNDHKTKN